MPARSAEMESCVALTRRELELVVLLAVQRRPMSRDWLADALWPEVDADAAERSLRHTFSVRQKLGKDAILVEKGAYRLGPEIEIDLARFDALFESARLVSTHLKLDDAYAALRAGRPEALAASEWFLPVERRLRAWERTAAIRLAELARDRGDDREALSYAMEILDGDPCDESAARLAVSIALHLDDRQTAGSIYARFASALKAEFGVVPAWDLGAVIAERVRLTA